MLVRSTLLALTLGVCAAVPAWGYEMNFSDDFSTNPLADGRATLGSEALGFAQNSSRFVWSPDGTITAQYRDNLPATSLNFRLPHEMNGESTFELRVNFKILSQNFSASPFSGQLAFGLTNSQTTGANRFDTAYDIMTMDYFPGIWPVGMDPEWGMGGPSIGPTLFETKHSDDFFSHMTFPFYAESDLTYDLHNATPDNTTIVANNGLPLDEMLTAVLSYEKSNKTMTLRILDSEGEGLLLNVDGENFDHDPTTIQATVDHYPNFTLDQFSLTLWNTSRSLTTSADIVFDSFSIQAVPEPASLGLLGLGVGLVALRRRK